MTAKLFWRCDHSFKNDSVDDVRRTDSTANLAADPRRGEEAAIRKNRAIIQHVSAIVECLVGLVGICYHLESPERFPLRWNLATERYDKLCGENVLLPFVDPHHRAVTAEYWR